MILTSNPRGVFFMTDKTTTIAVEKSATAENAPMSPWTAAAIGAAGALVCVGAFVVARRYFSDDGDVSTASAFTSSMDAGMSMLSGISDTTKSAGAILLATTIGGGDRG